MAHNVHAPSFYELEDAELVAVCDRIPERARSLADRFEIPAVYEQQEAMLESEELDAAVVLVEPASLYHVTRRCLLAGLPTMMEKPPGITSFQAHSLARLAEKQAVFLQVAFNRRFIPLVQRVAEFVRERTTINQIDGRFMKEGRADFDAGSMSAFVSDSIHSVDLVRWLARSEPSTCATVISRSNDDVDNIWSSVVRFENSISATIRANYQTGGRVHDFEIHGPGISAFINLGFATSACHARVIVGSGSQGYSLAAAGSGETELVEFDGIEIAGSDEFRKYYGYFQEDEDFVQSIVEHRQPLCPIEDAAGSITMVETLLRSSL